MRDIVNCIDAIIPGGVSVMDFAIVARTDQVSARRILNELVRDGIGQRAGELFSFSKGDRLKTAILALERGAGIDAVAEKIRWRDFEGLVAEILEKKGFATARNLMLKDPRMEIDVVGSNLGITVLIDCKHWKKASQSALRAAVQKQVGRTKHYVASTQGAVAVPVIVTLYQDRIGFINKVPIVPIFQFSSFVDELFGNLDEMEQVKA